MYEILLAAINAKYIHSNLAIYDLRAYCENFKENIELAEYTINDTADHILEDIFSVRQMRWRFLVIFGILY